MNSTSVNPQNNIDEDEIDLKEVFGTLNRYKYSIVVFAILFTIGATIFAYFNDNVYEASTTIELEQQGHGGPGDDMMMLALSGGGANLDNEQFILQSRFLSEKVLRGLEIGTRYFTTKNLRTVELYRTSPFVVVSKELDSSLEGAEFTMEILGKNYFILRMTPAIGLKEKVLRKLGLIEVPSDEPKPYEQRHAFGEEIVTEWFTLTINKVFDLENREYSFSVTPNAHMSKFIQVGLETSLVSKTGTILQITFQDNVALRAQEVINTLGERYLQQELEEKTLEADRTLMFIDAQIEEINKDVEKSQGKLEKFRSKHTIVDAGQQAMMTAENMAEYESKLQALEIESNVLKNVQAYINTGKDLSGISLGSAAYTDPALAQMIQKLQESIMARNSLLLEFTEIHPDIIKLTEAINSIKSSIKFTLKNDINIIEQRKQTLRHYIRKYQRSLEALPESERQLANLTRNTLVNEKVYNFLLEKRAETAILRSSTVSKTRVLDTALLPELPIKPKRLLIILVGMILGFIVGIALAFLRAFLDDTLKTAEDIDKATNIPLYAAIPQRINKMTSSQFEEAMRVLRTNLQFAGGAKKSKIVALTSSISGEGKTTVAVSLAKIIAATGKKVVLLDLDMRRSRMHEEFSITNKVGVSSVLSGINTLDEVLHEDVLENLDVITAGAKPPNPSELLVTVGFDEMIAKLSEAYEYIIFDTPPIGLVTDAMILLQIADIGLIVTRANYSKKSFLKNIERFATEHKLQNLGFIINGLESDKKQGYGYGYGYGYGSGKGYYD
ncbi:MAG: polysaccharide biosynthesis tyrosine autokinase [Sulfurimonadaceae bacterium]